MVSRRNALKASMAGLAAALGLTYLGPTLARELLALAQGEPMTGARLAGILRTQRAEWASLLAEVGPERMDIPGVDGAWSVKQVVAHLTYYEGMIVNGAQQVLGSGHYERPRTELTALAMDARNERIAADALTRPVAEVLAEASETFAQLLALLAQVPGELLNNASILGLDDDIPPWLRVANNSYAHYREHATAIRAWLDQR